MDAALPSLANLAISIPYFFHPPRVWQVCLVQRRTGSRYGIAFRSGKWSAKVPWAYAWTVLGFLMTWLVAEVEPILFLLKTSFHELLNKDHSIRI